MSSAHLQKFASVKPADIEWRNEIPFSREFDDVYFSTEGGLDESNYVFIDGNQLNLDWQNHSQTDFYLVELGFGSALNFLATAARWQLHCQTNEQSKRQHLHYLAIEMRPFRPADLRQACAHWPQFAEIAEQLLQRYPALTYGRHTLYFESLQLTLTLFFMPVEDALDDMICESEYQQNKLRIDHWYLDGFAPQKNTDMWCNEVCQKMAVLSRFGSRLATFSVAGVVKNALKNAGFKLSKRRGIGRKREVLSAELTDKLEPKKSQFINLKFDKPWFNYSSGKPPARVAIIGAGIAGCATACSLAQQGIAVELFDSSDSIASKASAAAAGIFHPTLTPDMNLSSQFSWQAYLSLLAFLQQLDEAEKEKIQFSRGLIRLLADNKKTQQVLQLSEQLELNSWIVDARDSTNNPRAIEFPQSGALNISAFCQLLLNRIPTQLLTTHLNTLIEALQFSQGHWHLISNNKTKTFEQVIFCGGARSQLLDTVAPGITHFSRGQSCLLPLPSGINKNICEQIYLVPDKNGNAYLGATFDDFVDDSLNQSSQNSLLTKLSKLLEALAIEPDQNFIRSTLPLRGTVGYRLHTQDRLPLVGGAADIRKLHEDFKNLGQKRIVRSQIGHYNLPGLWLNTAYGSHGLLYSLIAGEHLTALITNQLSPLHSRVAFAVHPARFYIRNFAAGN